MERMNEIHVPYFARKKLGTKSGGGGGGGGGGGALDFYTATNKSELQANAARKLRRGPQGGVDTLGQ